MAALPELARAAGLDPLLCPHCGRRVHTLEALDLLFRAMLTKIRNGDRVTIRRFGSFRAAKRVGRGVGKEAGEFLTIRFRPSVRAKAVIRGK